MKRNEKNETLKRNEKKKKDISHKEHRYTHVHTDTQTRKIIKMPKHDEC